MEKFLGKFKVIPELTEGFDAYFDAMKIPDVIRAAMKDNKDLLTAIRKVADDTYKEWNDYGNRQEEFEFQLDKKCKADTAGLETMHTFTLADDRIDGIHEVAGQTTTTKRYYEGDKLVFEASGNGATMKTFFSRVPE